MLIHPDIYLQINNRFNYRINNFTYCYIFECYKTEKKAKMYWQYPRVVKIYKLW